MVFLPKLNPHSLRASQFPSRIVVGLTLVLALGSSGCGHRRTVMRPVFGTPVQANPTIALPVEPACPTGPTMTTIPDSSEPFLNPAFIPPSASGRGNEVIRAGGSPPAPDQPAEPPLIGPDLTPVTPTSTNRTGATSPNRSRWSRGSSRQSSTTSANRVSLRDAVEPYVANSEDLFHPPKADRPWKYVVLHHSAEDVGSYDQIDRDHRKLLGFDGCGYHFVIGNGTGSPDGQITVADRWLNQKNGVHCQNGRPADVNEYGVGICLVGNFDHAEPTPKQVAAAHALVAYLGNRYAIASDHLGTHADFATGPTNCPGKNFPAEAILGSTHMAHL